MTDVNDSPGKRFQLRPSILSGGSGFGGDASTGGKGGFLLRPSALTAAADELEGSRKRTLDSDENEDAGDKQESKRNKTEETTAQESTIQERLGLDVNPENPSGIGTFGFANEEPKSNGHTNGSSTKEEGSVTTEKPVEAPRVTNYFTQAIANSGGGFGFNESSTSKEADKADSKTEEGTEADATSDNSDSGTGTLSPSESSSKTLLERGDEYQQKVLDERKKFEEVEYLTGEEGERHVLQIMCKLYVYDKEKTSWSERGRGTLNLNDILKSEGVFQSRLVFRTENTLIVQMNILLYPEMKYENVNELNLRLSTVDPETNEVKIFLIKANKKDSLRISQALTSRMTALKKRKEKEEEDKGSANEEGVAGGEDSKETTVVSV